MFEATVLKKYGVEVTFNRMTHLLNFVEIYYVLQKLVVGRQAHRQEGDLISLLFSIGQESRLKQAAVTCIYL
jgi:hypothetical protein